jgi:hypothetical protein
MDQDYVLCEAMSRADLECHIKRLRVEGNVAKADALEEWAKEVARTARTATPSKSAAMLARITRPPSPIVTATSANRASPTAALSGIPARVGGR